MIIRALMKLVEYKQATKETTEQESPVLKEVDHKHNLETIILPQL